VRVFDRELVDPEGKRRAVHVVDDGQVVANGGFIRAPRKPTNQSKPGGRRALEALARKTIAEAEAAAQVVPPPGSAAYYGYYSAAWPSYGAALREEAQASPPAAARAGGRTSCKGSRHTIRHQLKEICYFYVDEMDYFSDSDS
jgi:hypothetical protein